MYKKLLAIILLAATFTMKAQETVSEYTQASVEKSVFSVQTGLVGVWANNELKLSNQFALQTEIGLELLSFEYAYTDETKYGAAPSVSVEPKWYYNLEKRVRKGRNIKGNSGNAFSVRINYISPNAFLISDIDNYKGVDQINIIPKWSIRRVYGKHFIFETGFGLGPVIPVGKYSKYANSDDVYVDLHARIGYCF
ncbi:hypothetical protein FNO01nite_16630 [Flavobacterium noncentrifugens]|uniref:Outer membrane protein beta-barrel domain-containing protein n=1 Tax=Flavobacterium noncentrifugens TaxID=1128970 RepID=A0A1G8WNE0_9FLAO|nr:hypothetical protein [Flavobacterium noncentrifugens]GEP50991.1 hypothetical protein FNO01nite_16630 [Flavobacterium noncentrifugens]SDJ79603.1 hypothetical protein SAMN04487935_1883 [Flavobacterium noncentrifugens]